MSGADIEWFDRPIGEPVEILESIDEWSVIGRRWEERVTRLLAPLPVQVDHIGSTSVPGLAAKPVIDLQVQVPDLDDEAAYVPALEGMEFVLRARGAEFRFFRHPAGQSRSVHIHVCRFGSTWARDHLDFRDALRREPGLAAAYERLKKDLAETVTDRGAYNLGKEPFIRAVIARSGPGEASQPGE